MVSMYAGSGLVFGLLNPGYWRLAAACAWGVVLLWAIPAVVLLSYLAASVTGLVGVDLAHEQDRLVTTVILPVGGALVGAFVGARLRRSIAPRVVRALGRAQR